MNIFGVGGPELIAILIIMLVFAGPKRMIHWSYILGTYISKIRVIWSQTVDLVQQEFDEAGVDVKLPKDLPTRQNLNKSLTEALKPVSQPLQDSLNELNDDVNVVKEVSNELRNQKVSVMSNKKVEPKAPEPQASAMGTWGSDTAASDETTADMAGVDMGTWSAPATDK
jgi:Sec-independent protein translocase protein TatA